MNWVHTHIIYVQPTIFWSLVFQIFMSGIIAFIQLPRHKIFIVLFIISCLIILKVTFCSRIPKGVNSMYSNLAQFCHMSISFFCVMLWVIYSLFRRRHDLFITVCTAFWLLFNCCFCCGSVKPLLFGENEFR